MLVELSDSTDTLPELVVDRWVIALPRGHAFLGVPPASTSTDRPATLRP